MTVTPVLRLVAIRHSVPAGSPELRSCPSCGTRISVATQAGAALGPGARCGQCGTRLGPRPWSVEVIAVAALAVTLFAAAGDPPLGPAVVWWTLCAVPLVFIDLRAHRLPDALTAAALVGVLLCEAGAAAVTGGWHLFVRAVLCSLGYGVAFFLVAVPLRYGRGDVKLFVSAAALLGWSGWLVPLAGLFFGLIINGLVAVVLLATRRVGRAQHIPVGPSLVVGVLVQMLLTRLVS